MSYLKFIPLVILIACSSCKENSSDVEQTEKVDYYTQGSHNRMAAEWEPASGVMLTWPLCLPSKLVVEFAKDTRLFILTENEKTKSEALRWFQQWEIDTAKVKFIFAQQGIDAWWVRDWGPPAVFMPDAEMKLADGKYIYSTPVSGFASNDGLAFIYKTRENKIIRTDTDDNATKEIGKSLHMPVLDLPFISTGGNVMTDGMGTAFSTSILTNENRFNGMSDKKFFSLNKDLLGITSYEVLPNFEENGIQHIDCFMKLLDEERILVSRPPAKHPLHDVYERIINDHLKKLRTVYNRPYQILRIDTRPYLNDKLAAYTNSLILNKTVYVPLSGIPADSIALKQWSDVMPGYTIKGFEYKLQDEPVVSDKMREHYSRIGWNSDDALHCRTRAVWDNEMLYITVKRLDAEADGQHPLTIHTTIIDYSKEGLKTGSAQLYWRITGDAEWKKITLSKTNEETHFFADIPTQKHGDKIEYYISASSNSGNAETIPHSAPKGFYSFTVL